MRSTIRRFRPSVPRAATTTVVVTGGYAAVAGALSFLGWVAGVRRLTDWFGVGISIQPNTALAGAAAGVALLLTGAGRARAAAACGTLTGLLGATALGASLLGLRLPIDALLMFGHEWNQATVVPGRMGPPAAVSWSLTGTALVLLLGRRRLRPVVAAIGVAVATIAGISMTGYAFGADFLYSLPRLTAIAGQTSTILLAVAIGLVAAVPERQPMRGLLEPGASGMLVRRLVPLVVVVPLGLGFLRLRGEQAGLYDTAMGMALLVFALIALGCGMVWWGAAAVRRHEATIAALNARLRAGLRERDAVFRAAPVGIAVARDPACARVEINAAFADMLGIPVPDPAAAPGTHETAPFRMRDAQGRELAARDMPLQTAARTGEAVYDRIIVIERADGRQVVTSASAVPVQPSAAEPQGAVSVFADVTAERRATAEREELLAVAERARAAAETANRAKDEFLAVLSHELRSPLAAMLGWVRILRSTAATDPALVARAVDTLERNVWAQAQVIDDLLDVSRIASGELVLDRTRVDMADVVAGTVESVRPTAVAKQLSLAVALPDGPVEVDGDAARLQQVIGNVLNNAVKFTPENGRIAVRLRETHGQAVVEIEDTGQGIDPTLLPRVFDRFVQSDSSTTRRHGGLGLGLALVKELTALHGGTVAADSEGPGRGARFTIRLPLAASPATAERVPAPGPRRVLRVEDDEDSAAS